MVLTKVNTTLTTHAVFSEDESHRYLLRKIWNNDLPTCTVITKWPVEEGTLFLDLTTHLCLNQLSKLGYGAVQFVNLYSSLTLPESRKHLEGGYDEHTNIHIMESAKECDTIILAYGSYARNKKVIPRVEQLMEMLKPHKKKIKQLIDPTKEDITLIHPLNPIARHEWILK